MAKINVTNNKICFVNKNLSFVVNYNMLSAKTGILLCQMPSSEAKWLVQFFYLPAGNHESRSRVNVS